MNFYITSLFFMVPTFMVLILFEALVARRKGIKINRSADMISSLSSGATNTLRDGVKFSFAIISYSWLVEHMTVYKLEPVWLAVVIAFIVEDFSGYWMHRFNHRVNNLYSNRENDFLLMTKELDHDKIQSELEKKKFDRMKYYCLPHLTKDEQIAYFMRLYKSCDNYEIIY